MAARVRLVLARLLVVFALPLPFHGRMVVLRNMFIPGALHGIEASFLAESSVRKLRAAFCKVCWSSRQPLAHVGALMSLLDGPVGSDPAFCVVWFRFRLMRRYLAYRPEEVSKVKRLLAAAAEGCSGHGPAHLLVESAAEVGFSWCSQDFGWIRPGLPVLDMVAGPIQHFRSAILDAWRHRVSMSLCSRKGFRGGPFLDVSGTLQLLNSDHVRGRDKALLRGVMVGGVWNVFLLGKVRNCRVPCRFCGGDDHDGHLFWDCPFPRLVEIRENPEFHELMEMDKSFWPRCLLWHGWLPLLSGVNRGSPWAVDHVEGARNLLEDALGSYTSAFLLDWRLPGSFDAESAALHVAGEPDVWTDGSFIDDTVSADSWGHIDDDVQGDATVASCRGCCSVPGPLQSAQRAELWGVILALQASCGVHLGVDNLNVVRHVGRLLDGSPRTLGISSVLLIVCCSFGVWIRLIFLRLRVMRMKAWFLMVVLGIWIVWVTMLLMQLLNLVGGGFLFMSLMLVVIWLGFVIVGILLFVIFIVFLLLLLGLLLIMMMAVVLRRTLLFGLLVLYPRGPGLLMLFVILPFCLDQLVSGMGVGCLLV